MENLQNFLDVATDIEKLVFVFTIIGVWEFCNFLSRKLVKFLRKKTLYSELDNLEEDFYEHR